MTAYARYPYSSRPLEGQGVRAQSGLPDGGKPSGRGLSLDDKIPGTSTFNKEDENHTRDFDKPDDKSMYEVEGPDDQLTKYKDVNDDNADKHNSVGYFGLGPADERNPKTKYPYRDGIPNEKSAAYVVEAWKASQAPLIRFYPGQKAALRMGPIMQGLNPKYLQRAKSCSVGVSRFSKKSLRWIFSVDCGNGAKVVKLKATRRGNITQFSKMDLDIQCSCPAWRWQGPEHWSQSEEYLDGKPRGTATVPVIRDPSGINRVCKHVAAVLSHVKKWEVPK